MNGNIVKGIIIGVVVSIMIYYVSILVIMVNRHDNNWQQFIQSQQRQQNQVVPR